MGGTDTFQHRVTSSLQIENWVKRPISTQPGRKHGRMRIEAAAEEPQATILLIAPSEPIKAAKKGDDWRGGTHKRDVGARQEGKPVQEVREAMHQCK